MKLDDILRFLGTNKTQLRWKWMHLKKDWENFKSSILNKTKHVTYKNKICGNCGSLVSGDSKVCFSCGAKVLNIKFHYILRVLGIGTPRYMSVSTIIIFVNILLFGIQAGIFGPQNIFQPAPEVLIKSGAMVPSFILQLHQYWRCITYGYLHIGIIHLLFNMLALSQLASILEDELGGKKFFCVYSYTLIAAGILDTLYYGAVSIPIAGASGALFGLIGFGSTYYHFAGGRLSMYRSFFIKWAIYGLIFGIIIGADNTGHIAGFLSGCIPGYILGKNLKLLRKNEKLWEIISALLLLITIISFIFMIKS